MRPILPAPSSSTRCMSPAGLHCKHTPDQPAWHDRVAMANHDGVAGVRLDIWLDIACLFRTRSEAQKACQNGKIDVNGQTARQNRVLRPGDELLIGRPFGRKQRVIVQGVALKHVSKAEARLVYDDLTPKP